MAAPPPQAPPTLLFVYGSLLSHQYNHARLAEMFAGRALLLAHGATATPGYLLGSSSYPYLLLSAPPLALPLAASPCAIVGEVYAVPAELPLARLDEFEYSYDRVEVRVLPVNGGGALKCWAYAVTSAAAAAEKWAAVARGSLCHVPSGSWAEHRRSTRALPRSIACSAPGKVLIAGGYLILQDGLQGLVLASSARFHASVAAQPLAAHSPEATAPAACPPGASQRTRDALAAVIASLGRELSLPDSGMPHGLVGVAVMSPQFHAAWGYVVGTALPFAVRAVPLRASCAAAPPPPPPNAYIQGALEAALAAAVAAVGERECAGRLQSLALGGGRHAAGARGWGQLLLLPAVGSGGGGGESQVLCPGCPAALPACAPAHPQWPPSRGQNGPGLQRCASDLPCGLPAGLAGGAAGGAGRGGAGGGSTGTLCTLCPPQQLYRAWPLPLRQQQAPHTCCCAGGALHGAGESGQWV